MAEANYFRPYFMGTTYILHKITGVGQDFTKKKHFSNYCTAHKIDVMESNSEMHHEIPITEGMSDIGKKTARVTACMLYDASNFLLIQLLIRSI